MVERITRHLQRIARERNFQTSPNSLSQVQSYVREQFTQFGFKVREEPFSYSGESFSNLVASFETDPHKPRLIFAAHFDAVPGSPGADDNASGVAALLEAARVFAENEEVRDKQPWAVEFAAFNLEEYGMIGSRAYARKLKSERVPVFGMFSLEMVGFTSHQKGSQKMPLFLKPFYPNVGNFIGLVANTQSQPLLKKVKNIFREVAGLATETLTLPANGWVFPDARLSDHSPFWDEGFPALLVTDTSFFRNPFYHSPQDRVETLDLEFLTKVTEAVSRTACQLGRSSLSPTDLAGPGRFIDRDRKP